MVYTKEEFKRLWEANEDGSGITCEDCADCAEEWGLCSRPRCMNINDVVEMVVKAAGCDEYDDNRKRARWHRYPDEKPSETGEYLLRGVGRLDNRQYHMVCMWNEMEGSFNFGGIEFLVDNTKVEWLDVKEL